MPVVTTDINPEDTLEQGRQKINTNDDALATQGNSLETQQAAHVSAGHPVLYYSKAETDAAIAATIGSAVGYKELVGWVLRSWGSGRGADAASLFKHDRRSSRHVVCHAWQIPGDPPRIADSWQDVHHARG